jgi:hypothetical protein
MVHYSRHQPESNAMKSFLHRYGAKILGILNGFDRIRLRGTLFRLASTRLLLCWLEQSPRVLVKDFPKYAEALTEQLRESLVARAADAGRPVEYLKTYTNKEALVQKRRLRDGAAANGLICALSTLENCSSYEVRRNPKTHMIDLHRRPRKCLHYYFYFDDEKFGLVQVRLQTWVPFSTNVVLNGREWLARQLDNAGIGYQRRDNCFTWVEDFARAQELADSQLRISWETELDRLLQRVLPPRQLWLPEENYYWTAEQTEWATDLAFRDGGTLAELYPQLIRRGIETFRSEDVLRFLGHYVTPQGHVPPQLKKEITSDVKRRPEGVRIKHRAGKNTVKLYDKQGSVLRAETTLNDVTGLKSYRPSADNPTGRRQWRQMRKSVAEMARRAELSQASNHRYLEALGKLPTDTPLSRAAGKLCQPVMINNRHWRALNPLSPDDAGLLEAVSRGEWLVVGFRNRDIRPILYGKASDETTCRRQAARVSRLLGLLRAHGLIKKIPRTHRYLLTIEGSSVIAALLAANNATIQMLTSAA